LYSAGRNATAIGENVGAHRFKEGNCPNHAVAAVMRDPEVAKQLSDRGYQTIAGTPEEHQAQTNALVSQWIEVGKKVNLKE